MRNAQGSAPTASGAVALFMGLFVLQAWPALRDWTPTFDEPAHIGAGLSYLRTFEFKINIQHPPLLKEIAAVPLVMAAQPFPVSASDWKAIPDPPPPYLQWQIGGAVIYDGGDPDGVMIRTRLPFLILSLAMIVVVFLWGRAMLGPWAGACAAGLVALDPTLVAHGVLVTTDTGFALGAVGFAYALWRWLVRRSLAGLLLAGVVLGAALAAKFTGVLLLPVAATLVIAAASWVPAVPARFSNPADPYASEERGARIFWAIVALAILLAVAALVVHALYFFPGDPFLYLKGAARVNADHDPSYRPYMAGAFKPQFWTYYVVAWLLKEPLPSILLFVAGLAALLRRDRTVAAMDRAFMLLPPLALFAFYTLFSHNLGFRYLIPALPFMHLAAAAGAGWLWRSGSLVKRAAVLLLGAWLGLNAWGIGPDRLSYFNETACLWTDPSRIGLDAGSACGPRWLDDSNVDWGQGLRQLKAWLDRNAPGRRIGLGYFGTARPAAYGIDFERLSGQQIERGLPPGLHAISAHLLARALGSLTQAHGDGPENWILHTPPRAVVGHAYYVYEVAPLP